MITKNEFYGAYLIQAKVADDKALSVNDLFIEINRAWSVVESLQEKPEYMDGFILDKDITDAVNVYTKDTPIIQEVTSTCKK